MKIFSIVIMLGFSLLAVAQEFPYMPGITQITPNNTIAAQNDRDESRPVIAGQPVWHVLVKMTAAERSNSQIELILEKNASQAALQKAADIQSLWNNGRFQEALVKFPELENLTNIDEMAIGNAWRNPVPTESGSQWGTDVRIGNRDSVLVSVLDIHRATGNLFAVLLVQGDGATSRWDVYLSTDGGNTWSETYDWIAGYQINDISASIVANHCFVAYTRGSTQDQANLRRLRATDGQVEDFSNGEPFITLFTTTAPEEIKEVSLCSNQDYYNDRLYYAALTSTGSLRYFWDDPQAISWAEVATAVTAADRGLDISANENFSTHFGWISYIDQANNVKIAGIDNSANYTNFQTYPVGTSTELTSISAYNDTVTCFFDYHGANLHCRYLVRYGQDNGGSWLWGFVDDTTTTQESPSVTARGGAGVGVAYRFYTSPRQERFNWRFYRGSWGTSVEISDHEPYWNRPAIEHLGSNIFGVVYLSWNSPYVRAAYFDRSDWVGIEDENPNLTGIPAKYTLSQNYPNPFNPATNIEYTLPRESYVTLTVYNQLGQKVALLVNGKQGPGSKSVRWNAVSLPSGFYFYRLSAKPFLPGQTGEFTQTRKMILLK